MSTIEATSSATIRGCSLNSQTCQGSVCSSSSHQIWRQCRSCSIGCIPPTWHVLDTLGQGNQQEVWGCHDPWWLQSRLIIHRCAEQGDNPFWVSKPVGKIRSVNHSAGLCWLITWIITRWQNSVVLLVIVGYEPRNQLLHSPISTILNHHQVTILQQSSHYPLSTMMKHREPSWTTIKHYQPLSASIDYYYYSISWLIKHFRID